jgi:hypothetical protein
VLVDQLPALIFAGEMRDHMARHPARMRQPTHTPKPLVGQLARLLGTACGN